MRILDRYTLSGFFQIFWLALSAFVGIYLLVEFFERVDDFIEHQAVAEQYLWYFSGKLPGIIVQVTPLAVLLAVFLTLGGLSRHGELTAMRAGGVGLVRISFPLLAAGLLVGACTLFLDNYLVPLGARKANYVLGVELNRNQPTSLSFNNVWLREQNRFINIQLVEPDRNLLQGLTIFEVDGELRPLSRLDADQARYSDELGWVAPKARLHIFPETPGGLVELETLFAKSLEISRKPADFRGTKTTKSQELSLTYLHKLIDQMRREGFSTVRFQVDLAARIAAPFTCMVMAFLGIPFSLQRGRKSSLAMGISLSVGIGVVYHLLQASLLAFGYGAVLPPWVAAWAGNLLFSMLGLWMLLSVRQ